VTGIEPKSAQIGGSRVLAVTSDGDTALQMLESTSDLPTLRAGRGGGLIPQHGADPPVMGAIGDSILTVTNDFPGRAMRAADLSCGVRLICRAGER
jgi:hypothetical protein